MPRLLVFSFDWIPSIVKHEFLFSPPKTSFSFFSSLTSSPLVFILFKTFFNKKIPSKGSADRVSLVSRLWNYKKNCNHDAFEKHFVCNLLRQQNPQITQITETETRREIEKGSSISFQTFSFRYHQRTINSRKSAKGHERESMICLLLQCDRNTCNYGFMKLENIVMKFDSFVYAALWNISLLLLLYDFNCPRSEVDVSNSNAFFGNPTRFDDCKIR